MTRSSLIFLSVGLFVELACAQVSGGLPPLQLPEPSAAPVLTTPAMPTPDKLVQSIQAMLVEKGFDAGPPDGLIGPQTKAAILAAEIEVGLPVNGEPTISFLTALKAYAVPSKPPEIRVTSISTNTQGARPFPPCQGSYDAVKWTSCYGTRTYPDGDKYTGDFLNGKPDGIGLWVYKSGRQYQGRWENGAEVTTPANDVNTPTVRPTQLCPGKYDAIRWTNCYGTQVHTNGSKYIGDFLNGKPHGSGVWVYPSGREHRGKWVNGAEVSYRD